MECAGCIIIVMDYTAEAGVRGLERTLGTVCRAAAVKVRFLCGITSFLDRMNTVWGI